MWLKTSQTGKEHGESLIVFHGWGMNSSVWQAVKASLEADYKVTWVDLPGHGINCDINANSLQDIVDLILPVVEKNSHLLGWSLGGLVVQALAKRIPEQVKSMTLVATTPKFSQADNWSHAMSDEVLASFASNLQKDTKGTIKRFIGLQFIGVKNSKEIQRDLLKLVINHLPDKEALRVGLDILKTADFRDVATVSTSSRTTAIIPQHWIFAERDRLIPQAVINDLKLIRPDAQITLLKNTGHAPFMTHPQEFMKRFTAFFATNFTSTITTSIDKHAG